MNLNATSQYALKCISFIALEPQKLYSAKEISQSLDIPYKYLTKIMTKLSKNGVLTAIQGRAGGFVLAHDTKQLTIKDVLNALEDDSYKLCILGGGLCNQDRKCQLHDLWKDPKKVVNNDFLEKTFYEISHQKTA
ncbi:MAG: Rrf2 family transcriptional regulator [Arcobacteraceae bacterium]|jgi:Rrf2 family protein|nr:Rrf2 family transcriptional regulator [Arcobacteraceae bacterium]MDY0364467.1 Rrf2 family transcriptional regulator [Arcobacteraceae bacterium]